jgi:hypothetical protein
MEAGFLRHNIEFTPGEPLVSMASRVLNAVGNFLLSPARHLFNGRTVTAVSVYRNKTETDQSCTIQHSEAPPQLESGGKKFLKTIASIICFVPGIIFGSAVKGLALATSHSLREHYTYFPQNIKKEEIKPLDPLPRDETVTPSPFDQKWETWLQSNKKSWTENLGDQLQQAFPREVLNNLDDMDWRVFSMIMDNSLTKILADPTYDAATIFRKAIDNFFVRIVLSSRISPETRAQIPLTTELQQNFPHSYAELCTERATPSVIQNPLPPAHDQFPGVMKEEDKKKFRDMGIIFDSKGKVTHCPPQYKVEQEHFYERVWLVTISSQENQRLVRIQTDTPTEGTAIESVSIWDKR